MKKTFVNILFLILLIGTPMSVKSGLALADSNGGSGNGEGKDNDSDEGDDGDDNPGGGSVGSSGGTNPSSNSKKPNDSGSIQDAVIQGKAVSLSKLMKFLSANYDGRVINVDLKKLDTKYVYQVKLLTPDNKLLTLKLDALKLTTPDSASLY
jgi:uncharacterized membrane protein YkoI